MLSNIILSILLLLNFKLEARELYIWGDIKDNKLFCFDRETKTLVEKPFINIKSDHNYPAYRHIMSVTYFSNFIAASYDYSPYPKQHVRDYRSRGGIAILDVRDGSYREIEVPDLVNSYFSPTAVRSDKYRTKLLFTLINVEDWGEYTDDHEAGNFIWDINKGLSPVKISYEEYKRQIKIYSTAKGLYEVPSTNDIPTMYPDPDCVFVYNDVMLVWAHLENRYYQLRHISNFVRRKIEFISVSGNDGIKVWPP